MFKTLFRHTRRYMRPQGTTHFSTSRPSMMTPIIKNSQSVLATAMITGIVSWYVREAYRQTGLAARNVSGKPTPPELKDITNQDRYVFNYSELKFDGQGNGLEGRSCPSKYTIQLADGQIKHGYNKLSSDGREGTLNEMVCHLLAYHLLPESQPMTKLIEHIKDDKTSEYSLWVESIGENKSLLQLSKELNKNPKRLDELRITHLGTTCAFARLINSIDNFLKNYVVVSHADEVYAVYAIDFEKILRETPDLQQKYVNLKLSPSEAAILFLNQGAILEYKRTASFSEKFAAASGGAKQDGVGESLRCIGWNHDLVRKVMIDSITQDIEDGSILRLYRKAAALTTADIETLIKPLEHVLKPAEKARYIDMLQWIAEEARMVVARFDAEKKPDDEETQNTASVFKK